MPRPLRLEIPGGFYHLVNRGDRSEPIFLDDADRESFLEVLGEACGKTGWRIHAFCLMPNHFHLVAETPQANLISGMKWLLGTYSTRLNRRHRLKGHLFAGRYRSLIVDGNSDEFLESLCDYVHLNPARAKLIAPTESLRSYRWCSFKDYVGDPADRPTWLRVDRLFGRTSRTAFERRIEAIRHAEPPKEWEGIRKGWCFGNEPFRQRLIASARGRIELGGDTRARQESTEARAEAIVRDEFRNRGLKEEELQQLAKSDHRKVIIARRLRRETSVTLKWIANRLRMGSWTHTANCIYAKASKGATARPAQPRRRKMRDEEHVVLEPILQEAVAKAAEVGVEELPVHCL